MTNNVLSELTEDELRDLLPSHVQAGIDSLSDAGQDWQQIGVALSIAPESALALKGLAEWKKDLWDRVREEVRKFVCTEDPTYDDLREQWKEIRKGSVPVAVAGLAGAIGSQIGMVGGVIAPMVVWALISAIRIGKETFCASEGPFDAEDASVA